MEIQFKGTPVRFSLKKADLRSQVAGFFPGTSKEDVTDALVMFDSGTDTVTVDENASDAYGQYAALHECICCGSCGALAPSVEDPKQRCGAIDIMLIQEMPEQQRKAYILKRIEMFETLIERGLNPPLEASFRESLAMLKELL